jgi:membrane protease YdiL (CAAX protease family)
VLETAVAAAVCAPVAAVLAGLSWGNEHPVVELARPHPVVIAVGVTLLALANALGEEWFWRGCAMRALLDRGVGVRAAVLTQAVSFGLAHAAGLPGGPLGVAGAFVLGLVLGVLRLRTAGMPGCVAVHAAVDVAIFGLVANQVVWVG